MDMPFEMFELQGQDESNEFHNQYMEFLQQHHNFDQVMDFEEKKKKKKKKTVDLDDFLESDNNEPPISGFDS